MHHLAGMERFRSEEIGPAGPVPGRVLVVDDNAETRGTTVCYLRERHYPAVGIGRADLARQLQRHPPSLVVADLRFAPDEGSTPLRQIRTRSEVPVILIVGRHPTAAERIVYLELGADDVLCDPLNPRELLARIRATLRRQEIGRRSIASSFQGRYRFNGWELNRRDRTLRNPAGGMVTVTRAEYALLNALLEAPCRPLSRAELMRATRAHEDIHDRTIDAQVMRLRHKIEADASAPTLIRTRRGVGYALDASVELLV